MSNINSKNDLFLNKKYIFIILIDILYFFKTDFIDRDEINQ